MSNYESLNTENTTEYDAAYSSYQTSGYFATGFMICTLLSYSANWIDIAFLSDNNYLGSLIQNSKISSYTTVTGNSNYIQDKYSTVYNLAITFKY